MKNILVILLGGLLFPTFSFAQRHIDTTMVLPSQQKVDMIYDASFQKTLPSGVFWESLEGEEYFVFSFPFFYGEYQENYKKLEERGEREIFLRGLVADKRSSFDAYIFFAPDFSYYDVYCETLTGVVYGHSRVYRKGQIAMRLNDNMKKVIEEKQYFLLAKNWNHVRLIDIYGDYLSRIYALM